jgi:hypothetical protein
LNKQCATELPVTIPNVRERRTLVYLFSLLTPRLESYQHHDLFYRDSPKQRVIDVNSSPCVLRIINNEYEKWFKNEDDYVHVEDLFQY